MREGRKRNRKMEKGRVERQSGTERGKRKREIKTIETGRKNSQRVNGKNKSERTRKGRESTDKTRGE